jgi:molybdopterin/thiamine biosynthesis adenylyltransferase/rhodanese-related sulfurtransferase
MQLSGQENEYYNRQIILNNFGEVTQLKLKQARVLVIGAGGLGCPVLQYLTAAGIGSIGIADADVVSVSNLHRQVLYGMEDVGKSKAEQARSKLILLNPNIDISVYNENVSVKNAIALIEKYDVVCDCTDNFSARYLINDACVILNKPLVSAAILRFEGQLAVFNHQTKINYRDVFPEPPLNIPSCTEAGVIGVLCGIVGCMQANEVIKIVTEIGETIEGKLVCYDALKNTMQSFKINTSGNTITALQENYEYKCENTSFATKEISVTDLKKMMDENQEFQLIDVREKNEYDFVNIGGELIPLNTVLENIQKIDKHKMIIVYCKSGIRSAKAIELLQQKGFVNLYNLKGGILAYINEVDRSLSAY